MIYSFRGFLSPGADGCPTEGLAEAWLGALDAVAWL